MQAIGFWQGVKRTWRDAVGFVRDRVELVAVMMLLVLAWRGIMLGLVKTPIAPGGISTAATLGRSLLQLTAICVGAIAQAGLSIQVIRYVLIDDKQQARIPFFAKPLRRSIIIAFQIGFFFVAGMIVLTGVMFLFRHAAAPHFTRPAFITAFVLFVCAAFYIGMRLCLLYCGAALDQPTRWGIAWRDTEGHFWQIALTYVVTALPIYVLMLCIGAGVRFAMAAHAEAQYLALPIQALITTILIVIGAACTAQLYRRFAKQLCLVS